MKKETSLTVFKPDTIDDIKDSDLIKLSRKLLETSIKSTDFLNIKEMTPVKLKEAKLILGFLNATNNVIKTKMQFFKLVGIEEKVAEIKRASKRL